MRENVAICHIFLSFAVVIQSQTIGPANVMVTQGDNELLTCSSNGIDSTSFNWQFTPLGGIMGPVVQACSSLSPPRYEVQSGTNFCNLIISNVTSDQAGLYTCQPFGAGPSASSLIVLTPSCSANYSGYTTSMNNSVYSLNSSQQLVTTCSGQFSQTNIFVPRMIWTYPPSDPQNAVSFNTSSNTPTSFTTTLAASYYTSASNLYILSVTFVNNTAIPGGQNQNNPAQSFVWVATVNSTAATTPVADTDGSCGSNPACYITLAVVFSVVGAGLIGVPIFFIVKKSKASKGETAPR